MSQHDYFTRQAHGPDGGRRVGLGSSGGAVPPSVSHPQAMPGNGFGSRGAGGPGPRSVAGSRSGGSGGFHGGGRGGSGSSRGGGRHG